MAIVYRETKEFAADEIERLFLSVNWESGRYPDRIVRGLRNSSAVISAWDGDKLVGLVRGLDDGETVAFALCQNHAVRPEDDPVLPEIRFCAV